MLPLWRLLPELLVSLVRSAGDTLHALLEILGKRKTKTLGVRAGLFTLELTVDPERAREILVSDWGNYHKTTWEHRVLSPGMEGGLIILDGQEWHDHRRALADFFSVPAMERFARQVTQAFAKRAEGWPQGVFDLEWSREAAVISGEAMMAFFFDSSGAETLASDLSTVERGMESRVMNPLARMFDSFPPGSKARRSLKRVHALVSSHSSRLPLYQVRKKLGGEKALVREIQTLLGAGSTTIHLLGWCGQLLADHPECQDQLRSEIDSLGRTPSLQALEAAPYLEAVISEGLRLYPPAPYLLRRRSVKGRHYSFISIQAMNRHPDFWDRPDEFQPERWLDSGGSLLPARPYFIPFGLGPRACIGKRLAMIEARVVISELVRRFNLVSAIPGGVKAKTIILTRPRAPVRLFCLPAPGTMVASHFSRGTHANQATKQLGRRHDRPGG
jgi:cytochrome P450